jgi:hypothetical protein
MEVAGLEEANEMVDEENKQPSLGENPGDKTDKTNELDKLDEVKDVKAKKDKQAASPFTPSVNGGGVQDDPDVVVFNMAPLRLQNVRTQDNERTPVFSGGRSSEKEYCFGGAISCEGGDSGYSYDALVGRAVGIVHDALSPWRLGGPDRGGKLDFSNIPAFDPKVRVEVVVRIVRG